MAQGIYNILKGTFLTSDDAFKNWRFIAFITLLAMIMIYTGHALERKVHYISQLNDRSNELHSKYMDGRSRLMTMQVESSISRKLGDSDLGASSTPPKKIVVLSKTAKG